MDIEIRPIALDELRAYFAALEDGSIVGNAAAVSFRLTVPGGARVSASGITAVGVPPSHRRRGITTALMERQLRDTISRGEPVSVLHASEGGIYGRFGYGVASMVSEIDI